MKGHPRRVVMELEFEAAVGETSRAIREEGLQINARIDVRDHFWRDLGHDFRQYVLLEAWSPELALEALQHDLDTGAVFQTTFAIYKQDGVKTAVVVSEPLSVAMRERIQVAHVLEVITAREGERIARVMARLGRISRPQTALEGT